MAGQLFYDLFLSSSDSISSDLEVEQVQDFQVAAGDVLSCRSSSYRVQSFLGEGSFGKVAKCTNIGSNETVAIKIMKNRPDVMRAAEQEVSILKQLRALDPDTCNLVQWDNSFVHRGYMCLKFELLDISLRDFMKQRSFQPLPLKEIRPILHQLATALKHLKTIGIIHADLKPENIMMVDHLRQPHRVKIIDFGLACDMSTIRFGSYIQTRWYRSPEIMLGLPFTEAIDMWSLGCIAAELFLGYPFYPGTCEYNMMQYIVETQGPPPDYLLDCGGKTSYFFKRNPSFADHPWRLKTPLEYRQETGTQSTETRMWRFNSLDDLQQLQLPSAADNVVEFADRCQFVDLLKRMLHLDGSYRITPIQVLEHPFITMHHLQDAFHHVSSCFDMMDMCQRQSLTSDGKAVSESSSSTAQLAQRSIPLPFHPTGLSSRARSLHHNTDPDHSTARTHGRLSSAMKRKRVEDKAVESGNSNTKARLATSSSTKAASNAGPPNPVITAPQNGRETAKTGQKRARDSTNAEANKKRPRTEAEASRGTALTKTTTSNQGQSQGSHGSTSVPSAQSSSPHQAQGDEGTVKSGSKRARVNPSAESNSKRARTETETETLGAAQAQSPAFTSQTGTFSPSALDWYAILLEGSLFCCHSAGSPETD